MAVNTLLFILAITSQVKYCSSAIADTEVSNCLQCANSASSNSFCWSSSMFTNPLQVQCCKAGQTGTNCVSKGSTKCYKQKVKSDYYSGCPAMKKQNCGLQHNFKNLELYAENDKKDFTFNSLRYKTDAFKVQDYQACVYNILTPPGGYTGGKVYLTITNQEPGVKLHLQQNGKKIIWNANNKISVPTGQQFTLTAVPQKDNYNTSFSIEYNTDGTKDDSAAVFGELEAHQDKVNAQLEAGGGGLGTGAIIGIIVGVLILIAGSVFLKKRMDVNSDKVVKLKSSAEGSHQLANDNSLNDTQVGVEPTNEVEVKGKNKYWDK